MIIKEIIVVEGRDDTAAIKRAVEAETIETHGFGMSDDMWEQIERADEMRGIIVFTDPDYAGEQIRRKIKEKFPGCKEAFLPKAEALRGDNIGVENAKPEAIVEALKKARCTEEDSKENFVMDDLVEAGLCGVEGSRERREKVADILGIGYCNSRTLLSKLNNYGISREDFYGALQSTDNTSNKK